VSLEIQLPIPADVKPGEYALVVDLVNELVCWFSDLPGNEAHRQPLIIA
jgi:hypothetical protein